MYEMKPEYFIGVELIDEEHKQLFAYANEAFLRLELKLWSISDRYNCNHKGKKKSLS